MRTWGRAGKGKQAGHWFLIPYGNGVTGWDAECVLRRVGIPVIGRRYAYRPGENYGLLVPGSQAKWGEYNLVRAGFALASPLLRTQHANIKSGALPPAWGKPARPSGLNGWFVSLVGWLFAGDTAKGRATASTKTRKR